MAETLKEREAKRDKRNLCGKMKHTLGSVFKDRLAITPEICAILGKTPEQIADMDMRAISDAFYEKGYEITCHAFSTPKDRVGMLTMRVEDEPRPTDTGSVT